MNLVDDFAVRDADDALSLMGNRRIVRNVNNRSALLVQLLEHIENFAPVFISNAPVGSSAKMV